MSSRPPEFGLEAPLTTLMFTKIVVCIIVVLVSSTRKANRRLFCSKAKKQALLSLSRDVSKHMKKDSNVSAELLSLN